MMKELFFILLIHLFAFIFVSANIHHSLPKVYALYFPQFHEDPLNNKLWGKGYTDWDNVRKMPERNRFNRSILQPDDSIGYYDLLKFDIRQKQRMLAQQYGIDGFIYHHYWFHHHDGGPTLSGVIEQMLKDGEPNITFAFNWAMDSWQGTWHGRGKLGEILYQQVCPPVLDSRISDHYKYLKQFFRHPNYIKIEGVPLLLVLRSFPNKCHGVLQKLRDLAKADGYPAPGLYITGGSNPMSTHEIYTGEPNAPLDSRYQADFYYPFASFPNHQARIPQKCMSGETRLATDRLQYLSVMTHFDHTPRRDFENSTIWDRSYNKLGPAKSFELDLVTTMLYDRCCQHEQVRSKGGKFVVVNAWNEWAEGMCLEPSKPYGYQFLEAVKTAKNVVRTIKCHWPVYNNYFRKLNQTANT